MRKKKEKKGQINGARPSETIIIKEEPIDLKGGKNISKNEASDMKNVSKQTLKL